MELFYLVLFIVLLFLLTPLIGTYLAGVFQGKQGFMCLGKLEAFCYRIGNIDPDEEMTWTKYAKAMLTFNFIGFLALFFIQLSQQFLPLNPQSFPSVDPALALNTAVSFVTNTNWQSYAGETTLSYFTQMVGLGVQNFLSASTGLAVLMALIRGLTRKTTLTIGNYWVDLVRSVVCILLPLSIFLAIFLVSQGVVQTFSPYVEVKTLENATQLIPLGPAASQVAIKQLGTNGGGFFNANSAHPFENPTPLSNFIEILAIIMIPAALTYTYGIMIKSQKQGWLLFGVMFLFWIGGIIGSSYSEHYINPLEGIGSLTEGTETRFGIFNSVLWAVTTTATSNGSVNAMISSFSPLAGGIALFNMMLGEQIFGGIGVGLCSMLMFVLMMVFLAGLMVGRTPEYLGKKIGKKEVQWVNLAVLGPGFLILAGSCLAITYPETLSSLGNQGPHGLTEILYTFASTAGNNGSSFAGFNANTTFFNLVLGLIMLLGRLSILIPSLAIAGLLAQKKISPPSEGTFATDSFLFAILLTGGIFIVGALTFFPALSLGPIIEHFLMLKGKSF